MHANVRSLQRNFEKLNDLLMLMKFMPDILCISETKIKNNPLINVSLPGYDFLHVDSLTNAGGVFIFKFSRLIRGYRQVFNSKT